MAETKKCPYCGEEILEIAIKCKHCGRWLDGKHEQPSETLIKCPICSEDIPANSVVCPQCGEDISRLVDSNTVSKNESRQNTKKCPACDEDIDSSAIVCPHCGEKFNSEGAFTEHVNVVPVAKKERNLGWMLFVVFAVLGIIYIAFDNWDYLVDEFGTEEVLASMTNSLHLDSNNRTYQIESKSDVLRLVREDDCFMPRSTEVGKLFRKYYIFCQYIDSNDIKFSEYATAEDYLATFNEAIAADQDTVMRLELSNTDVNRIRKAAQKRYDSNYYSVPDNDVDGFFKKTFLECSHNFDECFKAQIAYDYLCLHWDYRDVDKLSDLYTVFSDEDFHNYYQDWVFYSEVGVENEATDTDLILINWDSAHNEQNLESFERQYSNNVFYYQVNCSCDQVIESKRKLFEKYPEYHQESQNESISHLTNGQLRIKFDKVVWTEYPYGQSKTYPSYLVLTHESDNWKIVIESDDITDANLVNRAQ